MNGSEIPEAKKHSPTQPALYHNTEVFSWKTLYFNFEDKWMVQCCLNTNKADSYSNNTAATC